MQRLGLELLARPARRRRKGSSRDAFGRWFRERRRERSAEGAIKYFLLGAFSTAFLLYGIALVYGATGATNLHLHGFAVAPTVPPDRRHYADAQILP